MSHQPSEFKHIVIDPTGLAYISGTTMKVRELVLEYKSYGWTAEQLFKQHSNLSMSQIHAALAYYFDHSALLDSEMQQDLALIDRLGVVGLDPGAQKKLDQFRQ